MPHGQKLLNNSQPDRNILWINGHVPTIDKEYLLSLVNDQFDFNTRMTGLTRGLLNNIITNRRIFLQNKIKIRF